MNKEEAARLLKHLPADERADLYGLLDAQARRNILPSLEQGIREDMLHLASFPEESTGSATTSEYISVLPETRVAAALKTVRAAARGSETVYIVYVLDREKHLLGTVSLRELLLADDNAAVESIMRRRPVSVRASWPRTRSTEMIRRYDLLALPVMDDDNKMMGIITVDDAMDIEKEQDASQLARFRHTDEKKDALLRKGVFFSSAGKRRHFFSASSSTEPMTSAQPTQPMKEKFSFQNHQHKSVLTTGSRLPRMAACTGER